MHIEFNPPLGSRTLVPVAQLSATVPSGSEDSARGKAEDYVDVTLTARLTPGDYAALVGAGVRVETWTNAAGAWEAVPFVEDEEAPNGAGVDMDTPTLHLAVGASSYRATHLRSPSEPGTHVLRARLRVRTGRDAAFTYRLIYPSGVRWLGSAREDGVLAPVRGVDAFFTNGERAERTSEVGIEEVAIGNLNVKEWSWAGWAVDEPGASIFTFTDLVQVAGRRARLFYLLPSSAPSVHNVIVPHAQLLRVTAPTSSLSIASDGSVILHVPGVGALERRVLRDFSSEITQQVLRSALVSASRAPEVALINDSWAIFAPDARSDAGSSVVLCGLSPSRSSQAVVVPADVLGPFAVAAKSLVLYAPKTHELVLIHGKSTSGNIKLVLGEESTAEFIACAAHMLGATAEDVSSSSSDALLFALPSHPYLIPTCAEVTPAASAQAQTLPTPPASPARSPRRSPSVSFTLPPTPPSGSRTPRSSRAIRPPPMAQRRVRPPVPRALPLSLPFAFLREPINALRGTLALGVNSVNSFRLNNSELSFGALLAAAFVAARAKAVGVARLLASAIGLLALRALVGALGWVVKRRPGQGVRPPRRIGSNVDMNSATRGAGTSIEPASAPKPEAECETESAINDSSEGSSGTATPVPHSAPRKPVPVLRWAVPARDALILAVRQPSKSALDKLGVLDVELDGVRAALKPLHAPGSDENNASCMHVYRVVPLFVGENAQGDGRDKERDVVLQVGLRA